MVSSYLSVQAVVLICQFLRFYRLIYTYSALPPQGHIYIFWLKFAVLKLNLNMPNAVTTAT